MCTIEMEKGGRKGEANCCTWCGRPARCLEIDLLDLALKVSYAAEKQSDILVIQLLHFGCEDYAEKRPTHHTRPRVRHRRVRL